MDDTVGFISSSQDQPQLDAHLLFYQQCLVSILRFCIKGISNPQLQILNQSYVPSSRFSLPFFTAELPLNALFIFEGVPMGAALKTVLMLSDGYKVGRISGDGMKIDRHADREAQTWSTAVFPVEPNQSSD